MPDSQPFSALQLGQYDDPPARGASSADRRSRPNFSRPYRARHLRIRRSRDTMEGLDADDLAQTSSGAAIGRRRQRSLSNHDEYESVNTPEDSGRDDSRRRRLKRRRAEPPLAKQQYIRYGHYGQVEPGRLKLDLISCDGGEHRDHRNPGTSLGPQNLLRHDRSVYCSERPHTNIILRHMDDTPFCLEKLHIIGPENGFTAPVREGLVYVSMTMKDLDPYIDPPIYAQRRAVHNPPYRRAFHTRVMDERLALAQALEDPQINAALDRRGGSYGRDADSVHDLAAADDDDLNHSSLDPEANCDAPRLASSPEPFLIEDSNGRLVTVLSDEEPGPEESSTQDVIDYRLRRMRLMRHRIEMEHWDRDDRWSGLDNLHLNEDGRDREADRDQSPYPRYNPPYGRLDALIARTRAGDTSPLTAPTNDIERPEDANTRQSGPSLPPDIKHTDKNVACARFRIRRGKYKVGIKFEPAVSGRFILLKLWAKATNVDVQSVIAKGFGGCRYFPAVEMR